jgi:hypothetical protein
MQDCNDYKPFDVLMMSSSIILDFCDDDDELFQKVLKAKKPTGIVFVFVFANKNAAKVAFRVGLRPSGDLIRLHLWRQQVAVARQQTETGETIFQGWPSITQKRRNNRRIAS